MEHNEQKCKVLHVRQQGEPWKYYLGTHELGRADEEKDIGVYIDHDLSFRYHIFDKTKKANTIAGIIKRTFKHMDRNIFTKLFKAIVRPHLEYANAIWAPHLKYLQDELENVQRRATRYLKGLEGKSYSQRLEDLKLPCLLYRRIRGDMIETFKLVTEIYDKSLPPLLKIKMNTHGTRGHKFKLEKEFARTDVRKFNFTNRINNLWNSLPTEVIESKNILQFEKNLDKHLRNANIEFNYENCQKFYDIWFRTR